MNTTNAEVMTGTSVAQPSALGLSQIERVIDAFVSPGRTFQDILRSTAWWLPFLLATVLSLVAVATIDKKVGFDTVVQNTLHDSPSQAERLDQLDPAAKARQLHVMAASYRYSSFASPLFILILSALGALVLWASFNFGLGARTTYGQMFAVWMYASLPRLLVSILMIVTITFGGNAEGFDLKNPVGTNPAFYLPNIAPWLKATLGFFDVIGIWVLILLVIGTATVAKVKRSSAAAVVVGWSALMMVLTGVITGATS